jgi:hypothetical protein
MRMLNRILGLLVAAIGMVIAGFGPSVFEAVSGRALPAPIGGDPDAMVAWSGVAFARAFGAVLFGIGTVLWAVNARSPRARSIHMACLVGFLFAALIVWSQQTSIWTGSAGWALLALFAALAAISAVRAFTADQPHGVRPTV